MPDRAPATARQAWMAVLARADRAALEAALAGLDPPPSWTVLRAPETGMVMVRGRAGGDGAAFNLGEMTVTRCAVSLACGTIGHAYVAGRDARKTELAAVLDALLQTEAHGPSLRAGLIAEQAARQQARRQDALRRAAATRVDFFSMVRMG
ncbi:phosphonate C-P lyase system protein PhnG [Elioraea sp. Yellowstone]|jgi:alpha-D-ribose 1-methylphosphonate 5-triphosphate synthase subunit PhnG|uniref:phosphonate C-P lyase system protein PhnG n=1 Tax=Elioraea sp. Yellowstone TaxID=2592070 RepID=UPI00115230B6|nr:phosphonate C-P lyase system protein PhnG [Elioraea sp. Yellowstone]TQF81643.1 phosphonate C-P lyase system protein PhnG [Elioraea sp. Yellowstone]